MRVFSEGRSRTLVRNGTSTRRRARQTPRPDLLMSVLDPGPIRLAVLDSDSGFVHVLIHRAEALGWQYRRLEAAARVEEFVAMRAHALVVDPAVLGAGAWGWIEEVAAALPGMGLIVCTGRTSVA